MKKILTKTNISLLIVAICAILFCGLLALIKFSANNLPTSHAEGTSATLKTNWYTTLTQRVNTLTITNKTNLLIGDGGTNIGDGITITETIDVADANSQNALTAYVINSNGIYDCVIYSDVDIIYAPADCSYLFAGVNGAMMNDEATSTYDALMSAVTALVDVQQINFECFDTSTATNMRWMFYFLNKIQNINLNNFDTTNVTNMQEMFGCCEKLQSINLSSFRTSLVKNMSAMFMGCVRLQSIDVSNFDTSEVTDMSMMFAGCYNMSSINISQKTLENSKKSWDTSKVTDMVGMFCFCNNLTSLNLSHFKTDNVTNFSCMFWATIDTGNIFSTKQFLANQAGLSVDDENFYTTIITKSNNGTPDSETNAEKFMKLYYFSQGSMIIYDGEVVEHQLKSLDISNFVIKDSADMMFGDVINLQKINAPKQCDVSIDLATPLIDNSTQTTYQQLSSATNGLTLYSENYQEETPSTGFVSEQLMPMLAIGLVSAIAVIAIAKTDKKKKYNI